MVRDSLFGERILWSGAPRIARTPRAYRVAAVASALLAAIALAFAVAASLALGVRVAELVVFAGWCASLSLAAWRLPRAWRERARYFVTEQHVIWRTGRLRRSIDRAAISYAIIRWDPHLSGVGDLELVRAVPTGALRRTLRLSLNGVTGPDRLWAIVRGLTPGAPLGDGDRPLGQRLDAGERVLWSGAPLDAPWTPRRAATLAIAALLAFGAVESALGAFRPLRRLLRLHAISNLAFVLVVIGVALGVLLMVAAAAFVVYAACVRPGRLARATRYLVTDRRVLIRRGQEELHLDRGRIADVIAAPARRLHDLFLVLDGPQARGFASSGAFGGADPDRLAPVLASIEDAETVGEILRRVPVELASAA